MPCPAQPAKVDPDTETVSVPVEPCVERQEPAELDAVGAALEARLRERSGAAREDPDAVPLLSRGSGEDDGGRGRARHLEGALDEDFRARRGEA
jgi:hypothetical protein